MKISIRVIAFAIAIFAATALNFASGATTVAANHQNAPGPMPTCNPFTEPCPPIR